GDARPCRMGHADRRRGPTYRNDTLRVGGDLMGRLRLRLALALTIICACGPSKHGSGVDANGGGDGAFPDAPPQPHTLEAIMAPPANPIGQLDLNPPAAQGFIATGEYADGVNEDLTSTATWTSSNPAVGTMTGASLSIPAFATSTAEVSKITASFGG